MLGWIGLGLMAVWVPVIWTWMRALNKGDEHRAWFFEGATWIILAVAAFFLIADGVVERDRLQIGMNCFAFVMDCYYIWRWWNKDHHKSRRLKKLKEKVQAMASGKLVAVPVKS